MTLSGLAPGATVTVRLSSIDARHLEWQSVAAFTADEHGRVNLDTARSRGGSYTGVQAMGLVNALAPTTSSLRSRYYAWDRAAADSFTLDVNAGDSHVGSTTFERRYTAPGVTQSTLDLATAGFIGRYYQPAGSPTQRPMVMLIGGSEGGLGLDFLAAGLASAGYPSLEVAYFKEPGLPQTLSHIPLEYFVIALRWLQEQSGNDERRVYVLGGSRGSEAAELLAVHYPDLVDGVIAGSPSSVALGDLPDQTDPAWTFEGRAVPYTRQLDQPHPTDNPDAVIPVERIHGPVFLACGGIDRIWTSCDYAHAIIAELKAHHGRFPHVLAEYPDAGHLVGAFAPYEPEAFVGAETALEGLHSDSNAIALSQVWPRLLHFLATTSH